MAGNLNKCIEYQLLKLFYYVFFCNCKIQERHFNWLNGSCKISFLLDEYYNVNFLIGLNKNSINDRIENNNMEKIYNNYLDLIQ